MQKFVIQWHITHLCNLRCKHCYQEEYNQHMPKENFYIILNKLDDYLNGKDLIPQINLTGGEPLLHPNFFEFAKEIKRRNMKLGILTNGTLIDSEMAKKISQLKPIFVQISLDGAEAIHDDIRGTGNFQKALCGIDLLKKNNVRVLVSFTAQKSNYQEFKSLANVCKKHHVDKLWWDRVVTDNEAQYLSTSEFQHMINTGKQLSEYTTIFNNYKFVSNQRSLQCLDRTDCGYQCSAGKDLIVILANGDVMPCRRLPLVVGNLISDGVKTIFQHPTMKELREFIAPAECLHCQYCVNYPN